MVPDKQSDSLLGFKFSVKHFINWGSWHCFPLLLQLPVYKSIFSSLEQTCSTSEDKYLEDPLNNFQQKACCYNIAGNARNYSVTIWQVSVSLPPNKYSVLNKKCATLQLSLCMPQKVYGRTGVHLHPPLTSGLVRIEWLTSHPIHFATGKSITKWTPELVQTHYTGQKPLALVRN
jgi:hypothetical protein